MHGPEKVHSNVIPLLCSIFLANQGASDGVGEGESAPWVSSIIRALLFLFVNWVSKLKAENFNLTRDTCWIRLLLLYLAGITKLIFTHG